jgi:hypothetical protein
MAPGRNFFAFFTDKRLTGINSGLNFSEILQLHSVIPCGM